MKESAKGRFFENIAQYLIILEGGLKDLRLGIKVKTKGKKNYRMEGLVNTGHSECPFL